MTTRLDDGSEETNHIAHRTVDELINDAPVREALKAYLRRRNLGSYTGWSRGDIEDHLQETYSKALAARDSFNPERSGLSWMKTIARNVLFDDLRSFHRKHRRPGLDPLETLTEPEPQPRWLEEKNEEVREAFSKLSPRHQRALHLRHVEGRTPSEIARILGLSSTKAATDEVCRAGREIRRLLGVSMSRPRGR